MFLILSLLLLIVNIARLVLEGMKFFCEKDVLENFIEKDSEKEIEEEKTNPMEEGDSNIRLKIRMKQ